MEKAGNSRTGEGFQTIIDENPTEGTFDEIEQKVVESIALALDVDPEEIDMDASLIDDLGAESLDFLDIAFRLERVFDIQFPRDDILERATEKFGEDVFVKDGVLTDRGLELVRNAMPEVDPDKIRPGLAEEELPTLFTSRTFVNATKRLLEIRDTAPTTCPYCEGTEIVQLENAEPYERYRCTQCEETVPPPSGDDLLFEGIMGSEN